MKKILTIELVPKNNWYINVRSEVSKEEWDILRRESYREANYVCEVCGGKGEKHPVECHEVWDYQEKNHIQKLIRLISLCPLCHKVKHIGRTQVMGEYDIALKHLRKVNKMTKKEAENYIKEAFNLWGKRNNYDWKLDLTFLSQKENK